MSKPSHNYYRWFCLGLSLIVTSLGVIPPLFAAPTNDNLPVVPNRRKPGASRPSTDLVEAPMRRKPGSNRDSLNQNRCQFPSEQVTALIPPSLTTTTISATPTLFFALPAIPPQVQLEFVVLNAQEELVYEKTFPGQGQSGLLPLTLPKEPLTMLGPYHWYFSIICNPKDRAQDLVVEGLIEPIKPSPQFQTQLSQATPLEQVKLYQSQNLWQDQLTVLGQLTQTNPNDPQVLSLWQDTLTAIALEPSIAALPVINP